MNIIFIVLVFGIIVSFHEFGHFIVAKINHISVTEFSVGMGPAIFSFKKKETKYSLRILPIGGYCMMMGEESAVDDENSFSNKSVWARMAVIFAGPLFNIILAFLFSLILVKFTGCDPAMLSKIEPGSAAEAAGLLEGDTIKEINGERIYNFREITLFMSINDPSKPLDLLIERADGTEEMVTLTPKMDEEAGRYLIGIYGAEMLPDSVSMNVKYAGLEIRYWMKATVTSLKMIFTGGVSSDDVMGPIGVGKEMNNVIETVKENSNSNKEVIINIILNMVNWSILLSVNLGIMNLIPIPALDGGKLLLLIIEAIRRKKLPQDKESLIQIIGFVFVIGLMVLVMFNDIKNVFF